AASAVADSARRDTERAAANANQAAQAAADRAAPPAPPVDAPPAPTPQESSSSQARVGGLHRGMRQSFDESTDP
ncbi:MAG: hypothetical protein PSX79_01340, partial [bacterium]|nr:hypothetical protein [bacterium]